MKEAFSLFRILHCSLKLNLVQVKTNINFFAAAQTVCAVYYVISELYLQIENLAQKLFSQCI